jgi:hypothetical protein
LSPEIVHHRRSITELFPPIKFTNVVIEREIMDSKHLLVSLFVQIPFSVYCLGVYVWVDRVYKVEMMVDHQMMVNTSNTPDSLWIGTPPVS